METQEKKAVITLPFGIKYCNFWYWRGEGLDLYDSGGYLDFEGYLNSTIKEGEKQVQIIVSVPSPIAIASSHKDKPYMTIREQIYKDAEDEDLSEFYLELTSDQAEKILLEWKGTCIGTNITDSYIKEATLAGYKVEVE